MATTKGPYRKGQEVYVVKFSLQGTGYEVRAGWFQEQTDDGKYYIKFPLPRKDDEKLDYIVTDCKPMDVFPKKHRQFAYICAIEKTHTMALKCMEQLGFLVNNINPPRVP